MRRNEQLHRLARQGSGGPVAARQPIRIRGFALLTRLRQQSSRGAVGERYSQQGGLDWARRLELVSVLLASVATVIGLWYSNAQVREQLNLTRQELGVSKESQITDRYTKAVETLGNDSLDVRLGGIYALQRIMEDSPRDHPTIANVLSTYVRTRAAKPAKEGPEIPPDVQAALRVVAGRNVGLDRDFVPNLSGARLSGLELRLGTDRDQDGEWENGAEFEGAILSDSDLSRAHLGMWNLSRADLQRARLVEAKLFSARLSYARLTEANLSGANMRHAELHGVSLTKADLSGADLSCTNLDRADLQGAKLTGADLMNAHLTDAHVDVAQLRAALINSKTVLSVELARDPAIRTRIQQVEKERGVPLPCSVGQQDP
ncbi:uncharacterized protein YjbI with pentapeptide repeats [Streptomyces sp. SLBN-118]|uniref:pentapeptide repeat-containing protein n=1 Tax=Streptomyces sp. SLBN-118 TaxID=2768454 RepID=UPI00114E0B7B|nr:pentapeptide repeat-containing protein [Streptomyces sp. SLBN-118]TQK49867.1 uncharacterized protein YjbI with pentapeptide repeats [Streptomyces sp. SLBN-118]